MKKINLKSILKKTFKKKNKQTKSISKKKKSAKTEKVKKKVKTVKLRINKEKKIKDDKKIKQKKSEINEQNLRLTKNITDQKPEIKKIKKQSSEKRVYKIKDYVVYPKHGVGQIIEFKKINIGGIDVETYVLKF